MRCTDTVGTQATIDRKDKSDQYARTAASIISMLGVQPKLSRNLAPQLLIERFVLIVCGSAVTSAHVTGFFMLTPSRRYDQSKAPEPVSGELAADKVTALLLRFWADCAVARW